MDEKEILRRIAKQFSGVPVLYGGAHCFGCLVPLNYDSSKVAAPSLCKECCDRIASALNIQGKGQG